MTSKNIFKIIISLLIFHDLNAQHIGMTFKEYEKTGYKISHLDSLYKSAVTVFETENERDSLGNSWITLLQDFGQFLHDSNFEWENVYQCWHKVYFSADGSIDYFLYRIESKDDPSSIFIPESQQIEFKKLLNIFISDYKFKMTAKIKFAQCGSSLYGK